MSDTPSCPRCLELDCNDPDSKRCDYNVIMRLNRELAAAQTEIVRLSKDPDDTLSDHPGCTYCMEEGTTVKDGEVCPKCGDRLPTRRVRRLEAELAVAVATLRRIQQWDCLNPPDQNLCADHPWLKRLVDGALAPSKREGTVDESPWDDVDTYGPSA